MKIVKFYGQGKSVTLIDQHLITKFTHNDELQNLGVIGANVNLHSICLMLHDFSYTLLC